MNTATSTAKTTETAITDAEAWRVVEAFGISIYPPARGGGAGWMAGWKGEGYFWGWGDSPISAVEDLLRKMGEME